MNETKQIIKEACKAKKLTLSRMLATANIQTGDYYQAINGKKSFFPSWRKRIAVALEMPEDEIFPEYAEHLPSTGKVQDAKCGSMKEGA